MCFLQMHLCIHLCSKLGKLKNTPLLYCTHNVQSCKAGEAGEFNVVSLWTEMQGS